MKDVYEFRSGDRVAGLHEFGTENGSFAEYAVALDWTTFHVPQNKSFEEAATIPTASLTAALALYFDMKLSTPYKPAEDSGKPILIYGVTSAVGSFAAKFARLSGLYLIIKVVGGAGDFARTLVDYVVDYRNGEDAVVTAVEGILANEGLSKVPNVFNAISVNGSLETILRLINPNGGTVSTVLPPKLFARDKEGLHWPPGVVGINSTVPQVQAAQILGISGRAKLADSLKTGC